MSDRTDLDDPGAAAPSGADHHQADPDLVDHDDWDDDWDDGWDEAELEPVDDDWGRVYDDADPYVGVPRESSRWRRLAWVLGGMVVFLVLVVGVTAFWLQRQLDPPGDPGEVVSFEIAEGQTVTGLASDLQEADIIGNATVFRLYARWQGFEDVQAGSYDSLAENSSMADVIDALEAGPAAPPPAGNVTIPEGLRLTDVVPRVLSSMPDFDEAQLTEAFGQVRSVYEPPEVDNLEGFLFPDTYRVEAGDEGDELKLLTQMVERFDSVAGELGYDDAVERTGLTPYQLVILASIIEREAKLPEDQGKVSRVIHNRIAQGMPLEVDATLLYAIGHKETLTQSDLETDSPYNTRLYAGLPPTPIAMPGRGALEAAINPEPGPWLFYVLADESGAHFFTDDYDEFLRVAQESRDQGIFE